MTSQYFQLQCWPFHILNVFYFWCCHFSWGHSKESILSLLTSIPAEKISIWLIMSFFLLICYISQQISILFAVWVHYSTRFLSYIYKKSNGISHLPFHWNNKIGHCPVNVMTQHNCPSTVAVWISCPKFSAFFVVLFVMREVYVFKFQYMRVQL